MPNRILGDLNMFYEDIGLGETVIFLHGSLSRGIPTFAAQIQAFQNSHRGIYPDLRGHGNTSCPDPSWTPGRLADDVVALMDELKIPQAHVVGHSMGGDVAMYCAINHPSKILSVVSISSAGAVNESVTKYLERFDPRNMDRIRHRRWIETIQKEHFAAHGGDWEAFLSRTISNCNTYPDFSEEELRRITVPLMLIYGSRDEMIKPDEIRRLAANIAGLTVKVLEGAGHFPHVIGQRCTEVNQIIKNFIGTR